MNTYCDLPNKTKHLRNKKKNKETLRNCQMETGSLEIDLESKSL